MGFSMSWIAVKDKATNLILQKLGLTQTGNFGEYLDFPIMGGILPSNWFLIVIDNWELVEAKKLANLSVDCEVIACLIEEHVMFCSAELWTYSNLCWRVEHDAQKGIEHLSVFGVLPKIYHSIASFYIQQQKVIGTKEFVDMLFEIPLQLANNIVGFKHDESDFGVNLFEQLQFSSIKKF